MAILNLNNTIAIHARECASIYLAVYIYINSFFLCKYTQFYAFACDLSVCARYILNELFAHLFAQNTAPPNSKLNK